MKKREGGVVRKYSGDGTENFRIEDIDINA